MQVLIDAAGEVAAVLPICCRCGEITRDDEMIICISATDRSEAWCLDCDGKPTDRPDIRQAIDAIDAASKSLDGYDFNPFKLVRFARRAARMLARDRNSYVRLWNVVDRMLEPEPYWLVLAAVDRVVYPDSTQRTN